MCIRKTTTEIKKQEKQESMKSFASYTCVLCQLYSTNTSNFILFLFLFIVITNSVNKFWECYKSPRGVIINMKIYSNSLTKTKKIQIVVSKFLFAFLCVVEVSLRRDKVHTEKHKIIIQTEKKRI